MEARWATIVSLGLLVAGLVSAPIAGAHTAHPSGMAGKGGVDRSAYVLRFAAASAGPARRDLLTSTGATKTGEIEELNLVELSMPRKQVPALRRHPLVRWIEPERRLDLLGRLKPNDPLLTRQWSLRKLGAFRGWSYERGRGGGVTVAVVDTGVDPSHPDLERRVVEGFDFVSLDDDPADDDGHGTHVAGIVGARPNNRRGVAGLSWGVRIMPLKACRFEFGCEQFDVAEAIVYAILNDARVVNLSLGGAAEGCPSIFEVVAGLAERRGTLLVAAAGNAARRGNPVSYPAGCEGYVGVGATTQRDRRARFSQYNDFVDLSAPGESIYSTIPPALGGMVDDPNHPGYGPADGTSMAAPHVSGLAALLFAQNPEWTPLRVQERMERTAVDLGPRGRDPKFGWGRISMVRALRGRRSADP